MNKIILYSLVLSVGELILAKSIINPSFKMLEKTDLNPKNVDVDLLEPSSRSKKSIICLDIPLEGCDNVVNHHNNFDSNGFVMETEHHYNPPSVSLMPTQSMGWEKSNVQNQGLRGSIYPSRVSVEDYPIRQNQGQYQASYSQNIGWPTAAIDFRSIGGEDTYSSSASIAEHPIGWKKINLQNPVDYQASYSAQGTGWPVGDSSSEYRSVNQQQMNINPVNYATGYSSSFVQPMREIGVRRYEQSAPIRIQPSQRIAYYEGAANYESLPHLQKIELHGAYDPYKNAQSWFSKTQSNQQGFNEGAAMNIKPGYPLITEKVTLPSTECRCIGCEPINQNFQYQYKPQGSNFRRSINHKTLDDFKIKNDDGNLFDSDQQLEESKNMAHHLIDRRNKMEGIKTDETDDLNMKNKQMKKTESSKKI